MPEEKKPTPKDQIGKSATPASETPESMPEAKPQQEVDRSGRRQN